MDNLDGFFLAFCWVKDNLGEIEIRLKNLLPFELIIDEMSILTNGINFQSTTMKQTITLPPHSSSQITLNGSPTEVGQLEIQGYVTHTLGVKSNCRLKHMKGRRFPTHYVVDVIPPLPEISVKTSLPQSSNSSTKDTNSEREILKAGLMLYDGETAPCTITITNESDLTIEHLEFSITSNLNDEIQRQVFQYNTEEIQVMKSWNMS